MKAYIMKGKRDCFIVRGSVPKIYLQVKFPISLFSDILFQMDKLRMNKV